MLAGLFEIASMRSLRGLLPLAFVSYAVVIATRSLWIAPFFGEVHGFGIAERGHAALVMAVAMSAGALAYGPLERALGGAKRTTLLGSALTGLCYVALGLFGHVGANMALLLVGIIGAAGLTYAILMAHARLFLPAHLLGHGVTFVNFLFIGGAGTLQWLSRLLVEAGREAGTPPGGVFGQLYLAFGTLLLLLRPWFTLRRRPGRTTAALFPGRPGPDGEGVQAARESLAQGLVDEPVALDPALALEGFRHDIKTEVGFARLRASRRGRDAGAIRRSPRSASGRIARQRPVDQVLQGHALVALYRTGCGQMRSALAGCRSRPLIIVRHGSQFAPLRPHSHQAAMRRAARGGRPRLRASRLQGVWALPGPKGRGQEGRYFQFCLEHVREYNASYNYFAGMTDAAVAAYQKDAVIGHRPTWAMGVNGAVRPSEEAERAPRATGPMSIRSAS